MNSISVVIIALNEEDRLPACLSSVKEIADEIIVVDSGSIDSTKVIAETHGAMVFHHAFEGYSDQKNYANTLANCQYILSMDADEALSETLKFSILKFKEDPNPCVIASFNRLNYLTGKPIKSCGWYPDAKIRLWKNGFAHWGGNAIHETLIIATETTVTKLDGDLIHNTYPTRSAYVKQTNLFAKKAALELSKKPIPLLGLKLIFSPVFRFFRTYFIKGGWKNGSDGYFISRMQTREVFYKYFWALKIHFIK